LKRFLSLILLILMILSCASAPSAVPSAEGDREPVPYGKDEFSPGLVKLRRAEVLFFGALPLFYMFTSLGYDLAVQDPPAETNDVLGQKMGITLSLSGLLSLADFIVGEVRRDD